MKKEGRRQVVKAMLGMVFIGAGRLQKNEGEDESDLFCRRHGC
jgi:hypothetical protein